MEEGRGGETGTKAHQFLPSISKALTEYTAPNMNKRHSIRQQHLNKCTMVLVICHLTKMGKKRNTKDKMTHIPVQSVNDPSKNKQSVLLKQVRHNTTRTGNSLCYSNRSDTILPEQETVCVTQTGQTQYYQNRKQSVAQQKTGKAWSTNNPVATNNTITFGVINIPTVTLSLQITLWLQITHWLQKT